MISVSSQGKICIFFSNVSFILICKKYFIPALFYLWKIIEIVFLWNLINNYNTANQ